MNVDLLYLCASLAASLPYLSIAIILVHYQLKRAAWRRKKRQGKAPGFCPSSTAMGLVLLFAQLCYRPSLIHAIEVRQESEAEEDDEGDPETPVKHLLRQLRRIRRGEPVDRLVVRL